jgi:hypothetical protein
MGPLIGKSGKPAFSLFFQVQFDGEKPELAHLTTGFLWELDFGGEGASDGDVACGVGMNVRADWRRCGHVGP